MAATGQTSAAVAAFKEIEGSQTIKLENTSKRDFLMDLEKKYQKEWADAGLFHINSPATDDKSLQELSGDELRAKYPKFFGTFPYPYMNGSLHLGHGFTISKIEFATGFERMLGKRALFPVGFHCTGLPIKASADKLIKEMAMFGENFEKYQDQEAEVASGETPIQTQPASSGDKAGATTSTTTGNVDKSKKSKVNAKSTGLTYQFQIMESIGVPREEIKKFADPQYWIKYFPPIAQEDLTELGARVDWRRSFVTTDINPYYDSFVRWQMNRLREMDYIKFGKRHTIYSPKDGQPCMDHDRQSGEGVGPQEYTALKMEVVQWPQNEATKDLGQKIGGRKVFMVAATLRPETMYGQTNCYVGTGITYGLFEAADGESLYLITERAARNMAYQDCLIERVSAPKKIAEIKGSDLIGSKIKAPYSVYDEVYVLPMENVLATKGTGVVTSVPSDSPDDYITLMDLRKKAEYYKINPEWAAHEPVSVITTPTYGDVAAPTLCKKMKINSQKDTKQLAEAKEIIYKEGFYKGVMNIGKYKGETVQDAKSKVRQDMIDAGFAFDYQEPEGMVTSRSGDECVVALEDQWYMDYGSPEWRKKADKLLANMNTYNQETRNNFEKVLGWLRQWACARSYGLGSKMPFDQNVLVESLSDSTIYMAYYTIAHLLHGGDIMGHKVGPLGVKAEDLTDETWDYIFGRADFPANATITREQGEALRAEYRYFYPMDIRSSGKDLIGNHLSMSIYVHTALFPESMWPLSMRANGHLLLNGKKMSKSTGNSLTLRDGIKKFGADATRLALADAGDGIEDANFDETVANSQILRVFTMIEWANEEMAGRDSLRTGEKNFWDVAFEAEMNDLVVITKQHYIDARYKDALKTGLHDFLGARDTYILACNKDGIKMHRDLLDQFIRLQALLVLPIAPHFSEHIWKTVLKEEGSVQDARFPEPSCEVNRAAIDALTYVQTLERGIRTSEMQFAKRKAKGKAGAASFDPSKPKAVRLFISKEYPEWQVQAIEAMKEVYDADKNELNIGKLKDALAARGLMKEKRAMPWCVNFGKRLTEDGAHSFDRRLPFDERETVDTVLTYLTKQLGITIHVEEAPAGIAKAQELGEQAMSQGYDAATIAAAEPGEPKAIFYNI